MATGFAIGRGRPLCLPDSLLAKTAGFAVQPLSGERQSPVRSRAVALPRILGRSPAE